jgi:hypothetical protein
MRTFVFVAVTAAAFLPASPADASGSGFDPRIIAFGDTRQQIQNTPLLERPYRPLHVYGNTARRRHSRGTAAPRSGSSTR